MLVLGSTCLAMALGVYMQGPPPEQTPLVAVLPFSTGKGVDDALGHTFEGALLGEIRKLRGASVRVMAPDDVVQALPAPLRGRLKRCTTAICRAQMAQAVNAGQALSGSLALVGTTLVLNLALLNSADGAQISQWTGRTPAQTPDQLLEQLPRAAQEIFPPPVESVSTATAPSPAQTDPQPVNPGGEGEPRIAGQGDGSLPTPGPASASQAVDATPVLPQDDVLLTGTPQTSAVVAQPDASPATRSRPSAGTSGGRGWSIPMLAASGVIAVPGVVLGLVAALVGVAGVMAGGGAHYVAFMINQELKSVPHKRNPSTYDIDWLIRTGRVMEGIAFISYAGGAFLGVVCLVALAVGLVGGTGLIVAAAPRAKAEKPVKAAPHPSPAATPSPGAGGAS